MSRTRRDWIANKRSRAALQRLLGVEIVPWQDPYLRPFLILLSKRR